MIDQQAKAEATAKSPPAELAHHQALARQYRVEHPSNAAKKHATMAAARRVGWQGETFASAQKYLRRRKLQAV